MVKARAQKVIFEAGYFDLDDWLEDLGAERTDLDLQRILAICIFVFGETNND